MSISSSMGERLYRKSILDDQTSISYGKGSRNGNRTIHSVCCRSWIRGCIHLSYTHSPYTVVAELAKRGIYTPPSLWATIDILNKVDSNGLARARVACLDVDGKDSYTVYPCNCPSWPDIPDALKIFNIVKYEKKIASA